MCASVCVCVRAVRGTDVPINPLVPISHVMLDMRRPEQRGGQANEDVCVFFCLDCVCAVYLSVCVCVRLKVPNSVCHAFCPHKSKID